VCKRKPPEKASTLGWAVAARRRREIGLVMNAPRLLRLTGPRGSGANPRVPAEFKIGFEKTSSFFGIRI
jgi:hypothetical protein